MKYLEASWTVLSTIMALVWDVLFAVIAVPLFAIFMVVFFVFGGNR